MISTIWGKYDEQNKIMYDSLLLNEAMSQLLIESCKLKVSPKGMDKDHQQTISTTFMIT